MQVELPKVKKLMGFFYDNGKWDKRGLTKNASKNNYIYAQLTPLTYLSALSTYSSQHGSVGYTKEGRKKNDHDFNSALEFWRL